MRRILMLLGLVVALPAGAEVFVNELHYDNAGTDVGERIEVAGDAGTSLAGWSVHLYNGADRKVYATRSLSGTLGATCRDGRRADGQYRGHSAHGRVGEPERAARGLAAPAGPG